MSTDKESLTKDIEIELENLQRLTKEMTELISRLSEKPNFIETRAAGNILHDFYCSYGFNLKWEQFSHLCYLLKDLTEKRKHSLIDFFKAI